jgi:uncharacterized protein YcnI
MHKMIAICLAASAAVLAVTPLAGGHSTVSLLQPQGKVLTSARAAYVLRAPNEKAKQDTIMVTMHVPEAVQTSISVKQTPDWSVVVKRRATGQVDAEGNPRFAIERVSWIAKNGKGMRVEPGFYGEWSFRMQNPATPQRLCFAIDQWYSKKTADGKPEVVKWSGASDSATPASCIDVVSS